MVLKQDRSEICTKFVNRKQNNVIFDIMCPTTNMTDVRQSRDLVREKVSHPVRKSTILLDLNIFFLYNPIKENLVEIVLYQFYGQI